MVGTSGAGKTHLAARIAEELALPRLELDAVFWQAGWTFRDLDEARGEIRAFVAANPDGWVADGNWTSRLDGLLDPGTPGGADVVVWIDHPRPMVMRRIVWRTLRRGIRRQVLWHGNRERPSMWFKRDPHENIMLWAWTQYGEVGARMRERIDAGWPVVRLSGQRQVDAWLASLGART